MITSPHPLIVIPARMASTRLPNKPLADINGIPMIVQVWMRAMEAQIGPVLVACDGVAIAEAVTAAGGVAVLTDPDLPSGSDRIWQAVLSHDAVGAYDTIINMQGDLPSFDGALLAPLIAPFAAGAPYDIMTLAAPIVREEEKQAHSVVKPLLIADGPGLYEAVDFVRGPAATEPMYHHIGVYAYRRAALARFVGLSPSMREQERKLEQMRALDAGMRIGCVLVDTVPLGVDTAEDLERARALVKTT